MMFITIFLSLFFIVYSNAFENIAGYTPNNKVTDENSIDLDQKAIVQLVAGKNATAFSQAKKVYIEGGFSYSVAVLTLGSALTKAVAVGASVRGTSVGGSLILGTLDRSASVGATKLTVRYNVGSVQSTYSSCQVGGLPTPFNTTGCFKATGTITVAGITGALTYKYNVKLNNDNLRTIQSFSKGAANFFKTATGYFPDFQKFFSFYGATDYADKIALAAFDGKAVTFPVGVFNFSLYDLSGREESTKKSTLFFNIIMYMIGSLENALKVCSSCSTSTCQAIRLLDTAVAYYSGSAEVPDGLGSGYLLHQLADSRCVNFKVCADGTQLTGVAKVTTDIFAQFNVMKSSFLTKNCTAAQAAKVKIAQKAFIPLTQGALRYAYVTSSPNTTSSKAEAESFIFAAAVLPLISHCNKTDAVTLYKEFLPGKNGTTKVALIKKTFEKNYRCLGFTCKDVGGLFDVGNNAYYPGMAPCV